MINNKGEFMEHEISYSPTSPEITRLIAKSWTVASNKALERRPTEQAIKLCAGNIELMTKALEHITDPACHARARRTIAHLHQQIDDLAAA